MTLIATFDNPADRDAGLESLHGEVQVGDEPPTQITLTPRKSDPHQYEAVFPVDKAGTHLVRVWAGEPDMKAVTRAATLEVPVELPNLEFDNPTADFTTLQAIARVASDGKVFSLADTAGIPDAFKIQRVGRTLEDRQEIWDAPAIYGTMLIGADPRMDSQEANEAGCKGL